MNIGSAAKVDYSVLVFSNGGVDQIGNWTLYKSLTDWKVMREMTRDNWFDFFEIFW